MSFNKNKMSLKITLCYVFIIFLLGRFYSFAFIFGTIQQIYSMLSVVVTVLILTRYIWIHMKNYDKKRKDKLFSYFIKQEAILGLTMLYFLIYFFITLFSKDGSVYQLLATYYPIIGTICFISMASNEHPDELINAYMLFGVVSIVLNFLEGVLFRDNSSSYSNTIYLLGGQNQYGVFIAITCAMVFVFCYRNGKKYEFIKFITLATAIFTAVMMKSATTYICVFVLFVLFGLSRTKIFEIKWYPKCFLLTYIIGWLSLVVFKIQYLFSDFIETVLHRDATLTVRTEVWDVVLSAISKRLCFGYGMKSTGNLFKVDYIQTNGEMTTSIYSAHNQILQNIYGGGLILLILFIFIFLIAFQYKNNCGILTYYFFCATVVIMVNWLTETPGMYGIFLMFTFAYYSKRFALDKRELNQCQHAD